MRPNSPPSNANVNKIHHHDQFTVCVSFRMIKISVSIIYPFGFMLCMHLYNSILYGLYQLYNFLCVMILVMKNVITPNTKNISPGIIMSDMVSRNL